MKYSFLLLLFFMTGCAIKPNYYTTDSFIDIPPVDEVYVSGKKVDSYQSGSTSVDVGTSFSDREITLKKDGQTVSSFTLSSSYIPWRGAAWDEKGGQFILHNEHHGTVSPVFLLLPMNTLLGIVPTASTLAFGILAQPFILINDIGLFNEPDYSLHAEVFTPFTLCLKGYNGLIVQDAVNFVNFPGVVYHNKWRRNGRVKDVKGDLFIPNQ